MNYYKVGYEIYGKLDYYSFIYSLEEQLEVKLKQLKQKGINEDQGQYIALLLNYKAKDDKKI